ncbi:hypothetical protein Alo02nite_14250 [Actinoplanes lobatus]|uniref:DUF6985 domain-containing protein n=2 Tax=Actinoplanes lobatus TaxID=113568 RepID=A0ABQ4ABZ7_9ACTN|nr:hypothetical protein Alo02nite_14250 [Actinoplanes lobatus]
MVVAMEIPGLGPVEHHEHLGSFRSAPVPVPVLGGALCRIAVEGYDGGPDFHAAIGAFLALDRTVLTAAAPAIFEYYRDIIEEVLACGEEDELYADIPGPGQVLDYVTLGTEPLVVRDSHDDRRVYVRVACDCDWEEEHGLDLVFRDGAAITLVGPSTGTLRNLGTFDELTEDVIYRRRPSRTEG